MRQIQNGKAFCGELTLAEAVAMLPPRFSRAHKGSFGRLLLIAGSARYTGAASLCTLAALRMGAGIVTLASTRRVLAAAGAKLFEPTFLPLPENTQGQISAEALPLLRKEAKEASALLIGCGLGLSQDGKTLVAGLLRDVQCPILLDADALNAVNGSLELLEVSKLPPVITPHIGEMARLSGNPPEVLKSESVRRALLFAQAHRCIVTLKDADTVVAAPDGRTFFYAGGNAGLARGGSGDVLAGFIASLLAQGMEAAQAAAVAVRLHGEAGLRCASAFSKVSMLPHQLPEELARLLAEQGL